MIGIFGFLALFVDHDLSILPSYYETLLVRYHSFNVESISRTLRQEHLIVTTAFEQHDLTSISAENESAVWEPSVTGKVIGDVSFLFNYLGVSHFQLVVLLNSIVLVSIVSSD